MSGKWAREADETGRLMLGRMDLAAAAEYLSLALTSPIEFRPLNLRRASAIIRRERKRLDASAPRLPDWSPDYSDERLVWITLQELAETGAYHLTPIQHAYRLREAESALRTLHKRGQSE